MILERTASEDEFGELNSWLVGLGMGSEYECLRSNDISFDTLDIVSLDDLAEAGMIKSRARRLKLAHWLKTKCLDSEFERFVNNDITSMAALAQLDESDLKDIGLTIGKRKKLDKGLASFRQATPLPEVPFELGVIMSCCLHVVASLGPTCARAKISQPQADPKWNRSILDYFGFELSDSRRNLGAGAGS